LTKEELSSDTLTETPKVKDKGKGILIEAPKPIKKKNQIEMDTEYARKLQEEINKEHEESYKNIDWNAALDHIQEQDDHDDTDELDQERDLLTSLIEKLKSYESDETIRLAKEIRSKLSDLIRPFDYDQLNNLYDLFVSQRDKSPEQHYFLKTSKMSYTSSNNEISKESFRVIPSPSVSRPQLKSNPLEDRVMPNNSQGKKQEVEDHRRNFKFSNNKTSVTASNDSLNAKTSNINFVCVTCGKCVLNDNQDMCILHYLTGVNSRTKMPMVVPISTREPKKTVNQSVATSFKKTVATDSTVKKPRNTTRKLYEHLVEIILFIIDSGCSKHMTCNLKLLTNFVETFLGTMKFGNDQITPILGYRDLVQGTITIKRAYYVKGLNHNLFFVGSRGSDLYSITLQNTTSPNPICLMAKVTSSQAWLWHRRLSRLNFDTINLLSKNDIAIVRTIQTDKGTEFLNKTLHAYFAQEGIEHQTSVARTPEQNSVVERWNRILVEAAHTMLSAAKVPLYFWVEAIATACFTQNSSLCYIVRDGENLNKIKEKGDACIFVGYSTQSRAYMVFNKRTKVIVETIHVNFDELPQMASDYVSSDPVPKCLKTALEHDSLSPGPQSQ
nr:hypothetical protein [Tanacetum cinerariifolium]